MAEGLSYWPQSICQGLLSWQPICSAGETLGRVMSATPSSPQRGADAGDHSWRIPAEQCKPDGTLSPRFGLEVKGLS